MNRVPGRSRADSLFTQDRFIAALGGMVIGAVAVVLGFMIISMILQSNLGLTNVRAIAAGGAVIGFVLGFLRRAGS